MTEDNRRTKRHRCGVPCVIKAGGYTTEGFIRDLSETGMRLQTRDVINVWKGDPVEIQCEELGLLQGVTRWRQPKSIGVQLHASTNTLAKVQSYFKNFADMKMAS